MVDGAKSDGTGGALRTLWQGLLGWVHNITGAAINIPIANLSAPDATQRCPSSATADNLAPSKAVPMATTDQNEPRKMLVSPTMLKNPDTAARPSALSNARPRAML